MEPSSGIEPETPSLPWKCSTAELRWHNLATIIDVCVGLTIK
jgi:hypothetical protein